MWGTWGSVRSVFGIVSSLHFNIVLVHHHHATKAVSQCCSKLCFVTWGIWLAIRGRGKIRLLVFCVEIAVLLVRLARHGWLHRSHRFICRSGPRHRYRGSGCRRHQGHVARQRQGSRTRWFLFDLRLTRLDTGWHSPKRKQISSCTINIFTDLFIHSFIRSTQRRSRHSTDAASELTRRSTTGNYEWRTCPSSLRGC